MSRISGEKASPRRVTQKDTTQPGETNQEGPRDIDSWLKTSDLLDSLPFYVLLIDDKHHILQANRAVREQLGAEPADIIGKYCPEVIHGTKGPWHACPLEEAIETGHPVEREALDENSKHWIMSAIYPVKRTPEGRTVFFHMVTDVNERKQAEEQLRISREQMKELTRHLETVREEERTRMARQIHDELGQSLATVKIYLSWLTKRLPSDQELLLENSKIMNDLIDAAIGTVMRVSTELRPGVLDDFGLVSAIKWQIREFEKFTDIKFVFAFSPDNLVIDKERSNTLFRVCHSALTNAVRHAGATEVKVSLKQSADMISLTVSDNGRGITQKEIANPRSFGIIGMNERVNFWDGKFSISGTAGKGTKISVRIPLAGKEQPAE
jgi:PAS domain S-box-containing protein